MIRTIFVWWAIVATGAAVAEPIQNWTQFRGPNGDGLAPGVTLPAAWSTSENVEWVAELPGRGWSSPIVWGDRVFVTAALSAGEFKEPTPGIYGNDYMAELLAQGLPPEEAAAKVRFRDTETSEEAASGVRWVLYCLDAGSGDVVWQRDVHEGVPIGGRHRKNTYASETPVTDGQRVYVLIGNVGLYAYSMEGKLEWSVPLEARPIYLDFGTASSPALHEDRLFVVSDSQDGGDIVALRATDGAELWRVRREFDHPIIRSSFSTPFLWKNSRRTEVVTLGPATLISYSLDGEELWRLRGTSAVAAPTPLADGDMLFLGSGSPSESIRPIFAIRAGASGDISLDEGADSNELVAWYLPQGGSYITSQLVMDDRLYVLYDKGFFAAYDVDTGEQIYRERFERGGHSFSSSPWADESRIFCLSEDGDTFVLEPGDEFRIERTNSLGEMSLATPAVSGSSVFVRTATKLYKIANAG